ncbi:MAG: hypothetical protein LBM69_05130, partial [Lachnospiraceae bacterium]|nr:hypothetical protein [Lachnospiraceae bacterium]
KAVKMPTDIQYGNIVDRQRSRRSEEPEGVLREHFRDKESLRQSLSASNDVSGDHRPERESCSIALGCLYRDS